MRMTWPRQLSSVDDRRRVLLQAGGGIGHRQINWKDVVATSAQEWGDPVPVPSARQHPE